MGRPQTCFEMMLKSCRFRGSLMSCGMRIRHLLTSKARLRAPNRTKDTLTKLFLSLNRYSRISSDGSIRIPMFLARHQSRIAPLSISSSGSRTFQEADMLYSLALCLAHFCGTALPNSSVLIGGRSRFAGFEVIVGTVSLFTACRCATSESCQSCSTPLFPFVTECAFWMDVDAP